MTTSIDNVISKIIRDTRVPDSSYISDMYEWIPECMGLIGVETKMEPAYTDVPIDFFSGLLPCGLLYVEGVEYEGYRLNYYNGVRRPGTVRAAQERQQTLFTTVLTAVDMPSGPVIDTTVVPYYKLRPHPSFGYTLWGNVIGTTFESGTVRVHYKKYPSDERGLPMIPDNADYREALYWFVRAKMIQTGYTDPVYNNDDRMAMARFEQHAARAIGQLTLMSPDEKETQMNLHVRFVPPADYWSSFFNSAMPEPYYDQGDPTPL